MAVIQVDTDQLAAQAQAALQVQQQVLELVNSLQQRMNELQGVWAGDAANAAQERFAVGGGDARRNLETWFASYAQCLRDIAARFAEADTPRMG